MATKLYISEYAEAALPFSYAGSTTNPLQNFPLSASKEPSITTQVVSFSGGATQSAPFNGRTKFIRVQADSICSIAFGVDPTATTDDLRLTAGQTEYFGVNPGDIVSAITNT